MEGSAQEAKGRLAGNHNHLNPPNNLKGSPARHKPLFTQVNMEVIAMKFEIREVTCPICQKRFTTISQKRRFCSAECRRRYWNKRTQVRRISDPILKEKSLQRLLAWLEAKKKEKERGCVG